MQLKTRVGGIGTESTVINWSWQLLGQDFVSILFLFSSFSLPSFILSSSSYSQPLILNFFSVRAFQLHGSWLDSLSVSWTDVSIRSSSKQCPVLPLHRPSIPINCPFMFVSPPLISPLLLLPFASDGRSAPYTLFTKYNADYCCPSAFLSFTSGDAWTASTKL